MLAKKRIRKKKSLKNVVVSTKMTAAEIKALRRYASKQGISFAALVRALIRIPIAYKHFGSVHLYKRTNRDALPQAHLASLT